uniref:Hemerythrin-like metal-binding domain protein n=1 Tax=Candidatus Kentrum sp. MB TaxID=2138164 RepID=A0A450Y2P4_9GAMM|nr:MAG: hemerythrin-like metal-binding domain protein [Candidatus Kentron sp. MB]VFK35821.1 MAG: hemerythrin-like metal-binding domain protein [Candidatus Kentron sp. MB]VFK77518.1 MAG: hemerythrin-like metal-binding domain protein [Candidatus Kentron sp. MB]
MNIDEFKLADVGIERFNKDHKRLFRYIREFSHLSERFRERAPFEDEWNQIKSIFRRLDRYVATHFKAEEELMAHQNYAHLTEHLGQHAHLISRLTVLEEKITQQDHYYISGIELFLFDWLSEHINVHDAKYRGVLDDELESLVQDALFNEILSVAQLKSILVANPAVIALVDVRTAWEQANGIIPGARAYPIDYVEGPRQSDFYNPEDRLRVFAECFHTTFRRDDFDEDKSHVLVCRSGVRTGIVLEEFLRCGLKGCELIGGVKEWERQKGDMVVKDDSVLLSYGEEEVAFPCI